MKLSSFGVCLFVGVACLGFSTQTLATSVDSVLATDSLAQHESRSRPTTNESGKLRNHSTERELDHSLNPFPRDAVENISKLGTAIEQKSAVRDHVSIYDEDSTVLFLDAITSIENRDQRQTLLGLTFMSLTEIDLPKAMDFFDGLKLEYQDVVIEAIFSHVKLSDLEICLEHIDHLSRHQKERAALAFFDSIDYLNYGSLIDIAMFTPYVAIPLIAGIEDRREQLDLAIELTKYWVEHNVTVASEMTTDYHYFTLDGSMLETMTKVIAEESPIRAIDIVGEYYGPFGAEFEVEIFETIFNSQPENFLTFIQQIRLDVVNWRLVLLSDQIYQTSPEIAVDYGLTLDGFSQEIYFENLIADFCQDEMKVLLSQIDRIPIPQFASDAANCVLRKSIGNKRVLTQDEFDILASHIFEKDFDWIDSYELKEIIDNR